MIIVSTSAIADINAFNISGSFAGVGAKNWFVIIVDGIILALLSYILGFDICIIVLSFGFTGIIFGIGFIHMIVNLIVYLI